MSNNSFPGADPVFIYLSTDYEKQILRVANVQNSQPHGFQHQSGYLFSFAWKCHFHTSYLSAGPCTILSFVPVFVFLAQPRPFSWVSPYTYRLQIKFCVLTFLPFIFFKKRLRSNVSFIYSCVCKVLLVILGYRIRFVITFLLGLQWPNH